jgi:hypothetical protein
MASAKVVLLAQTTRDLFRAVRIQHTSIDEQVANICTKPLSGTSLEGMKMFPWGSVDDCNIVLIFQD